MRLSDATENRWRDILPSLGISSAFLTGKHGPCPMCGGKDRFRFDNKDGRGTWYCNSCGAGDGFSLVMQVRKISYTDAAGLIGNQIGFRQTRGHKPISPVTEELKRREFEHLISSHEPMGGAAGKFLISRGLDVPDFPDLRYSPLVRYDALRRFPAMIGLVRSVTAEIVSVHRTFLTADGAKANVADPRRLIGPFPDGAAIRLGEATSRMGVSTGIETSLAATALFSLPVWATLNDTGLARWIVPDECREIVIFGDNDVSFSGQAASYRLAHRLWVAAKRDERPLVIDVQIPPDPGTDWNDVLRMA